ncbi:DUF1769-domain-containing protein [Coprinopsis marcescibilis]|uniref:DUF1769-domain-containing protein n=1 Tax=Coprinopsis marcescibilis TaxID=230819 RepID=A0A5C3KXT5_COPMA|nr:DUF1769-domain-containing protein [Coprinopsis marcescibilis]
MTKKRLHVVAGPSLEELTPISVNTSKPHTVSSDLFDGQIVAYIKDFTDEEGHTTQSEYFDRDDRQGVTWSIQVQGRFLVPYSADDILFGNTFDRPLKLPWGTSAVLRFMNYVDPTLEHDLQSQTKPWALSPLISTMPHFTHHRVRDSLSDEAPFPGKTSLVDDTSELYLAAEGSNPSSQGSSSPGSPSLGSANMTPHSGISPSSSAMSLVTPRSTAVEVPSSALSKLSFETASQRRTFFSSPEKRQKVAFGPLDIITTDFCYGFISFCPSLSLQLPGGLSFDLMRYWDGQPVRFVCCERGQPDDAEPWGRIFWCVSIEMVDEESDESDGINEDID